MSFCPVCVRLMVCKFLNNIKVRSKIKLIREMVPIYHTSQFDRCNCKIISYFTQGCQTESNSGLLNIILECARAKRFEKKKANISMASPTTDRYNFPARNIFVSTNY